MARGDSGAKRAIKKSERIDSKHRGADAVRDLRRRGVRVTFLIVDEAVVWPELPMV